jgi:amyloid beta precursor protein binding protein 1
MKAQSDVYIRLQNIYKAKARRDVDEVLKMVQATPGGRDVDPAEVELFCKNAAFVKLINPSGEGGGNGSLDGSAERLATVTGKCYVGSYLACSSRGIMTIVPSPLRHPFHSIRAPAFSKMSVQTRGEIILTFRHS